MARPERLTIDMTVVIDLEYPSRPRHARSLELFALEDRGEVELAIASSGQVFDTRDDPRGAVRRLVESGRLTETVQLAYPGVMIPGPNAIPGAAVEGFREAWDAVAHDWNGPGHCPGDNDALHVETHVLEKRDAFITDDPGLLTMCRRLHEEAGLPVVAKPLEEYLDSRGR